MAIECEFMSRSEAGRKAVVQVKGPKNDGLDAEQYNSYLEKGYDVFLYAPAVVNRSDNPKLHIISREEILAFYNENREKLPKSITGWENLFPQ